MKVLILGPVQSDRYFGGVATFTESLADAMIELGHETEILTDYSNKATTISGAKISAVSKKPQRRNILLPYLINKELNRRSSDLIISSLEYGLALALPIKSQAKTIHYLHAFPAKTMAGYLKTKALNLSMKLIARNVNFMIANSSLTSVINKEIYGIRVDDMYNIGLDSYFSSLEFDNTKKEKGSILYAGRMASEKNIFELINAIRILREQGNSSIIKFAGSGPELDEVKKQAEAFSLNIQFLGTLDKQSLSKEYETAEIFISLNPHEPFGLTYLEAIKAYCKIVSPFSGGQLDISRVFPENFTFTNPYSSLGIVASIKNSLESAVPKNNYVEEYFSYRILANQLIEKCKLKETS